MSFPLSLSRDPGVPHDASFAHEHEHDRKITTVGPTHDSERDYDETNTDGERSIKAVAISGDADTDADERQGRLRKSLVILRPDMSPRSVNTGHGGRGGSWSMSRNFGSRLRFWNRNRERDGPVTPT